MIKFYNTLTNQKEEFKPIEAGKVKIYTCGVTVYDRCHLGHARGGINFDVLCRFLRASGYEVTYAKNYTDIDDKIIDRANERGMSTKELAEENIRIHDEDMASVGINPPDIAPKATEHIPEIIEMIESLIAKEFAYAVDGNVFFRVRRFDEYGKLSGKNIDDLISGSRVEVDKRKEDALDFALWKASKAGEPAWESPWGEGRPGWHIECSAMSKKYLGETFDIHAGGSDLVFPHHENEIAQSECTHAKPYVNYWLHNGMVNIEHQKMSKSLGNFATIADLVKKFHPELIRFFVLSSQYRQPVDFSEKSVESSVEGLDRIYGALEKFELKYGREKALALPGGHSQIANHQHHFMEAMADDLNTPQALAILFELTKMLNLVQEDEERAAVIYKVLIELGEMLGLFQVPAVDWFKTPRIRHEGDDALSDADIDALIAARKEARAAKDWARADEVRDQLADASIQIEDRDGQTYWKRK